MDRINLGYSTKNIPIPAKKEYLQRLISSTEKFIKSIRWRTYFFLNPNKKPSKKETYGFTSTKTPPQIQELKEFEDGILHLVQNIEFKSTNKAFQKQLNQDIEKTKKGTRLLIPADKTTNFYKVKPDQYNKLLESNITKDYKKAPDNLETDILKEDKAIAEELKLDDRIYKTAKTEAFITLKDHKDNFNNNPKCRLINPTKSEIGRISKQILEKINTKIRTDTGINQWKNTKEVIDWYNSIENKSHNSFICFDVCEFYPSITEELLNKALKFAEEHTIITDQDKHIITQAKKSLLYNSNNPWCKKINSDFDVTMGSFDGAETCELIGLYMLSELKHLNIYVGLYRDDGLGVTNKPPREIEKIKKEICKIFNKHDLKITIEANKKSVDFLDITMDLRTGIFKPFMKANNTPLYVHKQSNHPPNILKNIPESINRRLSSISSNETIFNEAAPDYQQALKDSGYDYKLKYKPTTETTSNNTRSRKLKRKRNISWFNPPYSENVATNVGKKFLGLIDKCFPADHKLNKILNRNTVKVSYSCMPNMQQIISSHNKSILRKSKPQDITPNNCNCRASNPCPVAKNCLISGVVYQASITREDNQKIETYVGLTDCTFKNRYTQHNHSFRNIEKRYATTLSNYIWTLKENSIPFSTKWKILAKCSAFSTSSKKCNLCLREKYFIICKPDIASLNHRNELASECRHKKRHLLTGVT